MKWCIRINVSSIIFTIILWYDFQTFHFASMFMRRNSNVPSDLQFSRRSYILMITFSNPSLVLVPTIICSSMNSSATFRQIIDSWSYCSCQKRICPVRVTRTTTITGAMKRDTRHCCSCSSRCIFSSPLIRTVFCTKPSNNAFSVTAP